MNFEPLKEITAKGKELADLSNRISNRLANKPSAAVTEAIAGSSQRAVQSAGRNDAV
jgi:hypothetical protein